MDELNVLSQNGSTAIPLLYIGQAEDITGAVYTVEDKSIFRITAMTDTRLWYYKTVKQGNGLFLPAG